jgi:hypothetical protein
MAISLSSEQVHALAPDAASLKAARSLAAPSRWTTLGRDDRAVWGSCQGSARDPYLTQVDWVGTAFKCSCPSRKFPCKHGLALLLLLADQPDRFTGGEPPEWVAGWLKSRDQRVETKAAREAAPVDEKARARRVEQRDYRIAGGLDELELWLRDLVQHGLASAPGRGFEFWDRAAARLVDAQAPGAARRVREMAAIAASGEGWQNRMLEAIAQLALLVHAWRRLEELPAPTQADVRAAVGLPISHDDVLETAAVRDLWLVAGQLIYDEERLRVQRSWLMGMTGGNAALILEFAAGTAGFKNNLLAGAVVDAEICFFPGAAPLRGLIKAVHGNARVPAVIPGTKAIGAAFEDFGTRSAANPWTESHPAFLRGVVTIPGSSHWWIADGAGAAMPSHPNYLLLAFSRGRPVDLFGEWDGHQYFPLLAAAGGRLLRLDRGPLG